MQINLSISGRDFSVPVAFILAQNQSIENEEIPDGFSRHAYELDERLARLQEEEAVLKRQSDKDKTYEEYTKWQSEFDKVNQQIVEILCELQNHDRDDE